MKMIKRNKRKENKRAKGEEEEEDNTNNNEMAIKISFHQTEHFFAGFILVPIGQE